jgi:hypothetical protein
MSVGANLPSSDTVITTVRSPVWITASAGTISASRPCSGAMWIVANIPGTSLPPGLASSMRAFKVRVAALTSGSNASTLPSNAVPGNAGLVARTAIPGRTCAAALSGTSALTQTVRRPLMRNSGAPASPSCLRGPTVR